MSLGDHLDELRRRLLLALAAPLPLFIGLFFASDLLVRLLVGPIHRVQAMHGLPSDVQVLGPTELLLVKIKLSFIAALVLSTPWILYQAWRFVAPGLYMEERRFVRLLIPGSAVLTTAGVLLLYFVMLPLMLHVLVLIGTGLELPVPEPSGREAETRARAMRIVEAAPGIPLRASAPDPLEPGMAWLRVPDLVLEVALEPDDPAASPTIVRVDRLPPGRIEQTYRLATVIDFVLLLLLGIVIAFQMPLVILLLGWIGLVPTEFLRANRRYALIICAVIAAVVTPADIVSMLLMLVPLYGLYELGILLLRLAPADRVRSGTVLRAARGGAASSGNVPAPRAATASTGRDAVRPGAAPRRADAVPETAQSEQSIQPVAGRGTVPRSTAGRDQGPSGSADIGAGP